MAIHIHPVKIPARYYKPLGQIAAGWNLTEALVSSIVCHIHGVKNVKQGRIFAYRPMAKQKLDILKVSIKHFAQTAIRDELMRFHERATDLNKKRNMLVHGLWGRMPKEKTWKVFFHRDVEDMIKLDREVMTVERIEKIATQYEQLNRELKKWMAKHRVPPP